LNENNSRDIGNVITETLHLTEENGSTAAAGMIQKISSFFVQLRRKFASACEASVLAGLLEKLYIRILTCKVRVAAVFLLSFGIVSLVFRYAVNLSVSHFIADNNTVSSLFLIIISLVLFTTNRTVHSLIMNSRLLGNLSIAYSEQSIIFKNSGYIVNDTTYSTSFFLGIICGICSVVYPISAICTFILSILFVILIFNRPECGMLFMTALLPFLGKGTIFLCVLITFCALLYRYMLGKRHIKLGAAKIIMVISLIYLIVRGLLSGTSFINTRFLIYVCFYLSAITAMSLIRSTAMFRRTVTVLITMTRAFSAVFALYYLGSIFFGKDSVSEFLNVMNIDSLTNSLTSTFFIVPFLCMSIPLNFAYLIGDSNGKNAVWNLLCLIVLLASLVYVSSYAVILICILSCVAVLFLFDKKYGLLAVPAPFIAYAIVKLFDLIPQAYKLTSVNEYVTDFGLFFDTFKKHILFGAGPDITDFSGNMMINVLVTFGLCGFILLSSILIYMTVKTIKSVSAYQMKSNKARFLTIGLLCAQLSFIALCMFTDIYCDLNAIFMFSAVITSSFVSGPCYLSDYVDASTVREHLSK